MTDSHTFICLCEPRAIQIVHGVEGLILAGGSVRARGAEIGQLACIGIGASEAALDRRLGRLALAARH